MIKRLIEKIKKSYYKKEPDYQMTGNGDWVELNWYDIVMLDKLIKDQEYKQKTFKSLKDLKLWESGRKTLINANVILVNNQDTYVVNVQNATWHRNYLLYSIYTKCDTVQTYMILNELKDLAIKIERLEAIVLIIVIIFLIHLIKNTFEWKTCLDI